METDIEEEEHVQPEPRQLYGESLLTTEYPGVSKPFMYCKIAFVLPNISGPHKKYSMYLNCNNGHIKDVQKKGLKLIEVSSKVSKNFISTRQTVALVGKRAII